MPGRLNQVILEFGVFAGMLDQLDRAAGTFEYSGDLAQTDLFRFFREPVAAFDAPQTLDNFGSLQRTYQLFEIFKGYALTRRYFTHFNK